MKYGHLFVNIMKISKVNRRKKSKQAYKRDDEIDCAIYVHVRK